MNSILEEEISSISLIYGPDVLVASSTKSCTLHLTPYTGADDKTFISITLTLTFHPDYPFVSPQFQIDKLYGLADDEIFSLNKTFRSTAEAYSLQRKQLQCSDGYLFHFIDDVKNILSHYHDTV
jgi:hypothetical protein